MYVSIYFAKYFCIFYIKMNSDQIGNEIIFLVIYERLSFKKIIWERAEVKLVFLV